MLETSVAHDPPDETPLYDLPVVALDFEATGLAAWAGDSVCEVGLVEAVGDRTTVLMDEFAAPGRPLSPEVTVLTGIHDEHLVGAPPFAELMPRLLDLVGQRPLVIHNAPFDLAFIAQGTAALGLPPIDNLTIDTLLIARHVARGGSNALPKLAGRYGLLQTSAHRAAADAKAAALLYHALVPYLEHRGLRTVGDLVAARLAASAQHFVRRPSSFLLALLSRALDEGGRATIQYGSAAKPVVARTGRVVDLKEDRWLVLREMCDTDYKDRTYRVESILTFAYGDQCYRSPYHRVSL